MPLTLPELPFRARLSAGGRPATVRLAVPGARLRQAAAWAEAPFEPGFHAPAPDDPAADGWRLTSSEGEPALLVDRFAIGLWDGSAFVSLAATGVEVGVLEGLWRLETPHGEATVRAVALEADAAGNAGLALELTAPAGMGLASAWHVRPWLPAGGTWMLSADAALGCLTGLRGDWGLFVGAATPASAVRLPEMAAFDLPYPQGAVVVQPLGTLVLSALESPARVLAVAGPASRADLPAWQAARERLDASLAAAVGRLVAYERALEGRLPPAVGARAGRAAGGFPDTPLEDRLAFALQSHRTLYGMGAGPEVERVLRTAFDHQCPLTGRLPRHFALSYEARERFRRFGALPDADYAPEFVTLTALALGEEIENRFDDPGLLWAMWGGFKALLAAFKRNRPFSRLGGPVLTEEGLLMAPAGATWASGTRTVSAEGLTASGLPQRLPRSWVVQDLLQWRDAHLVEREHRQATVLLPDLNARWIKALRFARRLAGRFTEPAAERELDALLAAAQAAFWPRFKQPATGLLANLVTLDGRVDPTFTAFAVEAVALLGDLAPEAEARRHFQAAVDRLMVRREGAPFAFRCKEPAGQTDAGAHEAGAWPRESAWWLRLAARLGERAPAAELLAAQLAYQADALGDAAAWGLPGEAGWAPMGEPEAAALFCDAYWEAGA